MTDIQITDVTDGTVGGAGVFDKLMSVITAHIDVEYNKNRIKGSDYSTVYLGAMQSAMAQAVQFVLGEQQAQKQAELLDQKLATEEAQILDTTTMGTNPGAVAGMVGKQKGLLQQQTDGFQRDAEQKALKIMMDSWNIRRSTDSLTETPSKATDLDIDEFIDTIAAGIGVTLGVRASIGGTVSGATSPGLILQKATGGGVTGQHDVATHSTIMQDTGSTWTIDEWNGYTIRNITDGSEGVIISNTADTITVASLTGGTDNDWDSSDAYLIVGAPADNLPISNDGLFTFPTAINPDTYYEVTVLTNPPALTCVITSGGTGTIDSDGSDITNVVVTCT